MKKQDNKKKQMLENIATASSATEVVSRYGEAGAEFIKGYGGVDQETGQVLNRGLKKISDYKLVWCPVNNID